MKWSKQELEVLFEDWKKGVNVEMLAKKFGRSPAALRQQVAKANVYRSAKALSKIRKKASASEWYTSGTRQTGR